MTSKSPVFIDLRWYETEEGARTFKPYLMRRFINAVSQEKVHEYCSILTDQIKEISQQPYAIKKSDTQKFNEMVENGTLRNSPLVVRGVKYQFFWNHCAIQNVLNEISVENIDHKIMNLDSRSMDIFKILIYYVVLSIKNSFRFTEGISVCEHILLAQEPSLQPLDKNPVAYLNTLCNLSLVKSLAYRCFEYFIEGKSNKLIAHHHQEAKSQETIQKTSFKSMSTVSLLDFVWVKSTSDKYVYPSFFDEIPKKRLDTAKALVHEKIKPIILELEGVVYSACDLERHQNTVHIELQEGNEVCTIATPYRDSPNIQYISWSPLKLHNIQNKYIDFGVDNKIAIMTSDELAEMQILIGQIVILLIKERRLVIALMNKKWSQKGVEDDVAAHYLSNHILVKSLAIKIFESKKVKKSAPVIFQP